MQVWWEICSDEPELTQKMGLVADINQAAPFALTMMALEKVKQEHAGDHAGSHVPTVLREFLSHLESLADKAIAEGIENG